ncbi:MAG TPA: hypothetical protein VGK91_09180 [Candidatus Udaeobacter sp.]|jgi:hypothetical protein
MKRFLKTFELTKNEQRVVLLIMLALISIAFAAYERRIHRSSVQPTSITEAQSAPTPVDIKNEP